MTCLAISSFKGGTAKTSTALHLGAACAQFHQKKVLLIDFDAQANLTSGLGFDPDSQDSMAPVLQGKRLLKEVIVPTPVPHLDLIPADTWLERVEVSGALAADRYSHERLKEILKDLDYDLIIIDTPPSLCWLTESALIAAHHTLLCVTPEFYSVKGLQRLAFFIDNISQRHPLHLLGVLLSFWNQRGKNNEAFLRIIEETFPEKLLKTRVRRDVCVAEASIYGKPIFYTAPKSRAAQDYLSLSEEVIAKMDCLQSTKLTSCEMLSLT
jgi:chromosome partitioning protein